MKLFDNLKSLFQRHGGWLWESHLQTQLGVNRDELRAFRAKLTQGVDWRFEKNRVEISPAGVEKICAHFKVSIPSLTTVQTTGASEPAPDGESQKKAAKLLVWRTFPKNQRIIEGYRPGTDPEKMANRVNIKVRDSSKYTRFDNTGKPLELECRQIGEAFFEHVGPVPRRRGRV